MSFTTKVFGISAVLIALTLGMHFAGLVNLGQVSRDIGISEHIENKHIIVAVDITAGREDELQKDFAAIRGLLKGINLRDKVEIFLIHSRAESAQEAICSIEMPYKPGPMSLELSRAKKAAEQIFSRCWEEKILPLVGTNKFVQQTDLFGFLRFISQRQEFRKSKEPVLILFTDAQQVGDGFNFERHIPDERDMKRVKDNDLMADLSGVSVMLAGFTPTHNISNAHWRKLQAWWRVYLKEAGANIVALTSERDTLSKL